MIASFSRTTTLRLSRVPFADATAMQALKDIIRHFGQRNIQVVLCEASPRVAEKLENFGLNKQASDVRAGLLDALAQLPKNPA